MVGERLRYNITVAASYLSSRGHPTGALLVGIGKTSGGIAKKIGFAAGKLEQPLLRHRVGLDGAVGTDVAGRHSALGQGAADQQTAVAIERLALRAQEAHPMTPRLIDDAVEPGTKFGPPRHGLVVGDAVAVELGIARAAAEFIAELEIGEAFGRESCRQRLAREPWAPARERHRAHIDDRAHLGISEQRDEAIGGQVGMTDGHEIAGLRGGHGIASHDRGRLPRGARQQSVNGEVVMHPIADCACIDSRGTPEDLQ